MLIVLEHGRGQSKTQMEVKVYMLGRRWLQYCASDKVTSQNSATKVTLGFENAELWIKVKTPVKRL